MNYLSLSSEEEVLHAVPEIERPRLFRPRPNPFDKYTNGEFCTRYRLQTNTTLVVIGLLEEELSPMTLRNHSLSAGDQMLVTLRFYAAGKYLSFAKFIIFIFKHIKCKSVVNDLTPMLTCKNCKNIAYALKDYMMTPLLNPTTPAEQNYNNAHIQTRNCIERCLVVWKRRFACLYLGLRTKVDITLVIIVATVVLHNIAINENDTNNYEDGVVDEEVEQEVMQVSNGGGNAVRRALIENVFA
ncbi:hypothetical protein ILUMI_00278 [Ignelater luminosus]|uniref:DDE Tnp4 domain-containing protein n=1 Tax=Ignelater luminosus TaxID=2038154 RepID=A0A8K0DGS0_IGNLU|nr:hypothetical protein ILUMI_00278 [Ignelater luminosus]